MKYTEINGEYFETIKSKYTQSMIERHIKHFNNRNLSYYYVKPSAIKKGIYEDWREWYCSAENVGFFEVISASVFAFTIGAIYGTVCNPIGFIRITKDHNRLYLV